MSDLAATAPSRPPASHNGHENGSLDRLAVSATTSVPVLRAGLAISVIIPIAFASDTISIAIMEAIDNAAMALVPGAMESGLDDPLFWGTLAGGFALAFPFAFLANRHLIARGRGHALVHEYHGQ